MSLDDTCPCGLPTRYSDCCGAIHDGQLAAPTAEALMRARYSAFVRARIGFLHDSLASRLREDFDHEGAKAWATSDWLGLEVLERTGGTEHDDQGEVEFIARFRLKGVEQVHHERARFCREGGAWRYDDGDLVGESRQPVVTGPKTGRNEACPCGSGRKFKKCCGGRSAVASVA